MKRCPYCKRRIKDEAIICGFCGQAVDLIFRKHSYIAKLQPKKKEGRVKINLNDYKILANICLESYELTNSNLVIEQKTIGDSLFDDCIKPIFINLSQCEEYNTELDNLSLKMFKELANYWSLINFSLGLELGLRNINEKACQDYRYEFDKTYYESVSQYLFWLRMYEKPKNVMSSSKFLAQYFFYQLWKKSNELINMGNVNHSFVNPKTVSGGLTPFTLEVKRIKISQDKVFWSTIDQYTS